MKKMNRLRILFTAATIIYLLASFIPFVCGQSRGYTLVYSPPRAYSVDWVDVKALYVKEEERKLYFYIEYYGAMPSSKDYYREIHIYMDTDRNPQTGWSQYDYYISFGQFGDGDNYHAILYKWNSTSESWRNINDLKPNTRSALGSSYLEIWVDKQDIGYTPNGIHFYIYARSYVKAMQGTDLSYVVDSSVRRITVDGEPDDWGSITPLVTLPQRSINPSELEVSSVYVTNDDENLYFRFDTRGKPTTTLNKARYRAHCEGDLQRYFYVYLDTDNKDNTGYKWYGGTEFQVCANFYACVHSKCTYVNYYKYTGTGNDWSWQEIDGSETSSDFNSVFEFKIPLSLLGLKPRQTVINMKIALDGFFIARMCDLTYPPDTIPPVTVIAFKPKRQVGSRIYVSGSTAFMLSANDTSGVKETKYRIDNGSWNIYSSGFRLSTFPDGEHTISYYSVDNAGNVEAEKTITVVLDKTPPVTTMALSGPMYQVGSTTCVSTSTSLTLSPTDGASGVKETKYMVDEGSWSTYTTVLTFSSLSEGSHIIRYYSVDNVNNTEIEKTLAIFLDKTPPKISEASPTGTVSSTSVSFSVKVEDSGSGVKEVRLIVDGVPRGLMSRSGNTYTKTLSLSEGSHTWVVETVDNVGNTATQSYSFTVSIWMSLLPNFIATVIIIVIIVIAIMLRRRGARPPPTTGIEEEIKKYEEYLERLEQLRKEGKVSEQVYEKLRVEYEKKLDELINKWRK
jgi:hypothetical protein